MDWLMSDMKACSKCKKEKLRSNFSRDRSRKDGLQPHCKSCKSQYHKNNRKAALEKSRQWQNENYSRLFEYRKAYREENHEKIAKYSQQYRQDNKEKLAEYDKNYRQRNPDKIRKACQKYRRKNPSKYSAWQSKRNALRQKSVPESLKDCPAEKRRLEQIYRLRDVFTRVTGVEHHVDHIWPLSKGGPHWSGNLQIIPARENLRKHAIFCKVTAKIIQESLSEDQGF